MPVVIKLKGMPWEASSRDIKEFFLDSKLSEHDIHLAPSQDGKACGVGFACFFDDEDARKAMQQNGSYLGKRYVQLFLSSKAEMEKALRDGVPRTTAPEVRSPKPQSKQDGRPIRGERTSERSEKPRERSRSPHGRSGSKIGKKNESFSSGSSSHARNSSGNTDFRSKTQNSFVKPRTSGLNGRQADERGRESGFRRGGFQGRGRGYVEGGSTRGRGITRGSTRGAVRGGSSRGSISFSSSSSRSQYNSDDSQHRPSRGGQHFGPRHDSRTSHSNFFGSQQSKHPQHQSVLQSPPEPGAGQSLFLKLSGLPFTAQNADIMAFFKGVNITAVHIIPNKSGPYAGRSSGSAFIECKNPDDCVKALQKHGQYLGRRYLNVERCTFEEIVSTLKIDLNLLKGQFPAEFNARGLQMPSRNQGATNFPSSLFPSLPGNAPSAAEKTINLVAASANINLGDIKDGCVVGIRNLPSTTIAEEILRFFHGFLAIPDSVRIHYLDANRCSGDAMITFVSNEQARNAIRQLSGKQFGSRKIELFLL